MNSARSPCAESQISTQYASSKGHSLHGGPQSLMIFPFLDQIRASIATTATTNTSSPASSMVAPVANWPSVPSGPGRSPPSSPPTPVPCSDPDAPLNLSKPKSSPGRVPSTTEHSGHLQEPQLGPLAATAPKLLPPSLVMPRFLPYAGLPPHVNPTGKLFVLRIEIGTKKN
ncbi:uncharacterized protein LOC142327817 [Lycorma delicatula]|uniref:uncharacterized protein LOC142327817 n=1 Tax=Lycorma delicatula TaxID=130591 RepID=UPI003F5130E0